MAILVTGGAGYIGSHLVYGLADAGEQPVVIDNLSAGFQKSLPPDIPLIIGNCGNSELVSGVLRQHAISAVIHLAGSISVSESIARPDLYFENNVNTTQALVNVAIKHGVDQFIFSSSAAVYGQPSQIPVTETAPTVPVSPYGQSKLLGEELLQRAGASHGLRSVMLRYFNVAGADPLLRTGQSALDSSHVIKRPFRLRSDYLPSLNYTATTMRHATEHAFAIISTSRTSFESTLRHYVTSARAGNRCSSIAEVEMAFRSMK